MTVDHEIVKKPLEYKKQSGDLPQCITEIIRAAGHRHSLTQLSLDLTVILIVSLHFSSYLPLLLLFQVFPLILPNDTC